MSSISSSSLETCSGSALSIFISLDGIVPLNYELVIVHFSSVSIGARNFWIWFCCTFPNKDLVIASENVHIKGITAWGNKLRLIPVERETGFSFFGLNFYFNMFVLNLLTLLYFRFWYMQHTNFSRSHSVSSSS